MPAVNPIPASGEQGEILVVPQYQVAAAQPVTEATLGVDIMQPSATGTNAAGTSENVAAHVATIAALALIGIIILRQSGFRFVVGASVGGS